MRRRLLFVIPSFEVGGTISSLSSLIGNIKNDYNISIMALSHDGNFDFPYKSLVHKKRMLLHAYYCSYMQTSGFERCIIALMKILKRFCLYVNFDLERILCRLYYNDYKEYETIIAFQEGNPTKYVSLIPNKYKIAWIHCDYRNYSRCGLEFNIYKDYTKIVCVSNYTRETFLQIYPALHNQTISLHNLLNTGHILKQAMRPIDDERFIHYNFTIISVGRIHKVKRFDYIPEIARKLKDSGCSFKWYIIGPHNDDEYYRTLVDNIILYNVCDYVIYLGNKTNPYPYFNHSNLLVSLSSTEACPMIFNEAKLLNLPIVTTDFGSSYEFIKNGENGIISSIQNICDVLRTLIFDDIQYNRLKEFVSDKPYTNECILQQLHALLSEVQ